MKTIETITIESTNRQIQVNAAFLIKTYLVTTGFDEIDKYYDFGAELMATEIATWFGMDINPNAEDGLELEEACQEFLDRFDNADHSDSYPRNK